MFNENLALFNKLARLCGNRYLAVKYLASQSRDLGDQYKGVLLESQLLTWALTGIPTYDLKELERRKHYDSDIAQLEDYLCYVDDEEVCDQVRKYYKISLRSKHVILDDSNTLDDYRQMRVNIILRMLWYGLPETEGGAMAKIKLEDYKYVKDAEPASVETIQDVDIETEVLETDQPYEFVDASVEPAEVNEKEVAEEIVESEPEPEQPNITEAIIDNPSPYIKKVTNCRIYSSPSTKLPARSFNGNVEVIGHVDEFTIVNYVRPGFGKLKGYTLDI